MKMLISWCQWHVFAALLVFLVPYYMNYEYDDMNLTFVRYTVLRLGNLGFSNGGLSSSWRRISFIASAVLKAIDHKTCRFETLITIIYIFIVSRYSSSTTFNVLSTSHVSFCQVILKGNDDSIIWLWDQVYCVNEKYVCTAYEKVRSA